MNEEFIKISEAEFISDMAYFERTKDNYYSGSDGTTLNEIRRDLKYLTCLLFTVIQERQTPSSSL